MEQQIILMGIGLDELLTKIDSIVETKLSTIDGRPRNTDSSNKYLTRTEVSKLLKISLPTLHEWTKLNRLQSYKIGNRVLYNQEEVEKAVVQTNHIKYKKHRL